MSNSIFDAKVAGVLSNKQLIINKGKNSGIKKDFVYEIYPASPILVRDPDSNKEIGKINNKKAEVIVKVVEDEFSICETVSRQTSVDKVTKAIGDVAKALYEQNVFQSIQTTFAFDESALLTPDGIYENLVRIGDLAVFVSEIPY